MRLPMAADGWPHNSRARVSDTIATGRRSIDVCPGEIPARDQRRTHRLHVAWRNDLEQTERWNLGFGIGAILREERIVPALAGHRHRGRDRDRGDAGQRRDPVHDRLVHPRNRDLLFDLRARESTSRSVSTSPGRTNPGCTSLNA